MPHAAGNDVYHAELADGTWSLAENISDSPKADSRHPVVVGDTGPAVHILWEEHRSDRRFVGYRWGRYAWWHPPVALVYWGTPAHVRAAVTPDGALHVVWLDGTRLLYTRVWPHNGEEPFSVQVLDDGVPLHDPILWATETGDLYAAWVRREGESYTLCFAWSSEEEGREQ